MYSAYQNKDAQPNRVTDNRHQRYRDDDDEQMEYLALWKLNHPKGAPYWPLMMMALIGIIGVLCVVSYLRKPAPLAISQANCVTVCHWGEVPTIKGYEDYKKAHPSPAEKRRALKVMSDKHLLQDLIATTGGNP